MSFEAFWEFMQVAIVPVFVWFVYEIRRARESIDTLNISVAVAVSRISYIETDHGIRISRLEQRDEKT